MTSTKKMASIIDMNEVVKHISNGTLAENLCRVCLKPLGKQAESIFTKICKEEYDYCVADILKNICDIHVSSNEHHQVCTKCFVLASLAYKFYLLSKQTDDILHFYTDELLRNIDNIDLIVPQNITSESLCIPLPLINPIDEYYSFDLEQISKKLVQCDDDDFDGAENTAYIMPIKQDKVYNDKKIKAEQKEVPDVDDSVVMVLDENGQACYYQTAVDGTLVQLTENEVQQKMFLNSEVDSSMLSGKKRRKKKPILRSKACMYCPANFKFVTKLQHHVKQEHGIDIFSCKLCKKIIVNEDKYNDHLIHVHRNVLRCDYCGIVLKKRNVMIAHIKHHLTLEMLSKENKGHVCQECSSVFVTEEELKQHIEHKHESRYTCYYCGRQYKGHMSLELHIKKHEKYLFGDNNQVETKPKPRKDSEHSCDICGKSFVDGRSLMWHKRLHTNERPFICEICGRGFVSANRRSQHALCSHTAPTRRCPLCPATFHLRSMVNTHIRKVHFRPQVKRRRSVMSTRAIGSPVAVADLSVELQAKVIHRLTD